MTKHDIIIKTIHEVSERQKSGYRHFEEHNKLTLLQNSMIRVLIVISVCSLILSGLAVIL